MVSIWYVKYKHWQYQKIFLPKNMLGLMFLVVTQFPATWHHHPQCMTIRGFGVFTFARARCRISALQKHGWILQGGKADSAHSTVHFLYTLASLGEHLKISLLSWRKIFLHSCMIVCFSSCPGPGTTT